ncbi:MmcQ/YjbR family DNA-binding protein [Mucilaginibacter calamicampi]|uniref:MmcQ/YjbR family DNA-binding protein n=1 Tax=Mucilaginibacter calamicampi TaxID=1302352 RepID=A0ABW2Z2R7_9SPHI
MNIEQVRDHCLAKPGATEGFPFDEDTLVFKVGGKMFLLISLSAAGSFNVKCEPELAVELRERHPEVKPGYHMNKKLWNTVDITGALSDKQLKEMIDQSYLLVFAGLPKKVQAEINTSKP